MIQNERLIIVDSEIVSTPRESNGNEITWRGNKIEAIIKIDYEENGVKVKTKTFIIEFNQMELEDEQRLKRDIFSGRNGYSKTDIHFAFPPKGEGEYLNRVYVKDTAKVLEWLKATDQELVDFGLLMLANN